MTDLIAGSYQVQRVELARLMKEQGWSIQELAKKAGVHRKTLARLFEGKSLRISTIRQIAVALGKTPDALITLPMASVSAVKDDNNAATTAALRYSFDVELSDRRSLERDEIPALLEQLQTKIRELGPLVVDSTQPGTIRISSLATQDDEVRAFVRAFCTRKLDTVAIVAVTLDTPIQDVAKDALDGAPLSHDDVCRRLEPTYRNNVFEKVAMVISVLSLGLGVGLPFGPTPGFVTVGLVGLVALIWYLLARPKPIKSQQYTYIDGSVLHIDSDRRSGRVRQLRLSQRTDLLPYLMQHGLEADR